MNLENDENVRLLPAGRPQPTVSDATLVEEHRRRQGAQNAQFSVSKPEYMPADEISWLGRKKESAAVRQHNRQLDAIASAEELNEFGLRLGLRLEVIGVSESARAVTEEVSVFRGLAANSLEATLVQELLLDSVERTRQLVSLASENYRRRAFG